MNGIYVLITGSSKGLGKALALVFANNGYNIILHGRSKKELNTIKKNILSKKVDCDIVQGDLTSKRTLKDLTKIAKEKSVGILINNAGVQCPNLLFEKLSKQQIYNILETNLFIPIDLSRKIYDYFIKSGSGTIINIISKSALVNQNKRSIYSAAKWGLRGFTDTLRIEAKKYNIRVIGIYPARIKTCSGFIYGMEPDYIARKIFDCYKNTKKHELILER